MMMRGGVETHALIIKTHEHGADETLEHESRASGVLQAAEGARLAAGVWGAGDPSAPELRGVPSAPPSVSSAGSREPHSAVYTLLADTSRTQRLCSAGTNRGMSFICILNTLHTEMAGQSGRILTDEVVQVVDDHLRVVGGVHGPLQEGGPRAQLCFLATKDSLHHLYTYGRGWLLINRRPVASEAARIRAVRDYRGRVTGATHGRGLVTRGAVSTYRHRAALRVELKGLDTSYINTGGSRPAGAPDVIPDGPAPRVSAGSR
ncbi:unnamed protein product [Danaus chrysippus]|uniref:(African queen) hypothetical protein n=1 Tax=Danaus chrysippus TaxID=151541 RepID=A0A8J2QE47_9NEOP|nr:unnamed protein product [Danaus chrysippus]